MPSSSESTDRIHDLIASWPRQGRVILCAEGPYEPVAALTAYLGMHPPTLTDPVHVVFGTRRTPPPLPPEPIAGLSVGGFLPGRGLRHIERFIYHRASYDDICQAIVAGDLHFDAVIACVTPPDEYGVRSFGAVNGYLQLVVDDCPAAFVEEIAWLPSIDGAAVLRLEPVVVPSHHEQGEDQPALSAAYDSADLLIARKVIDCIPPDSVLALGIGRIPDAVATLLCVRADLQLTSGVIQPMTQRMFDCGAFGKRDIRAMSVVGPDGLLSWAANEPTVRLEPSTIIHNPRHLAEGSNFVAVLGALHIDLAGNVNSELSEHGPVSGVGGAPDFARGAHESSGGASIVAVRSTARNGGARLVKQVAACSVPRAHVDFVVTERGVAALAERTPAEREEALRRIF